MWWILHLNIKKLGLIKRLSFHIYTGSSLVCIFGINWYIETSMRALILRGNCVAKPCEEPRRPSLIESAHREAQLWDCFHTWVLHRYWSQAGRWKHLHVPLSLKALWKQQLLKIQFFQKLGLCASLLWKFSYHLRTQLDGMKVSVGLGTICACDTANDEAKLYKLSSILWVKCRNESTVDTAALGEGICCDSCSSDSTDTPTWATDGATPGGKAPKGCATPWPDLRPEILKMALGLSFVMKPSSCHTWPPLAGSGREK